MKHFVTTLPLLTCIACRSAPASDSTTASNTALASQGWKATLDVPSAGTSPSVSESAAPAANSSDPPGGFKATWMTMTDLLNRAHSKGIACQRFPAFVTSTRVLDGWGRPIQGECVDGDKVLRSSGPDGSLRTRDDFTFSHSAWFRPRK